MFHYLIYGKQCINQPYLNCLHFPLKVELTYISFIYKKIQLYNIEGDKIILSYQYFKYYTLVIFYTNNKYRFMYHCDVNNAH